jgi:hypothetical protein
MPATQRLCCGIPTVLGTEAGMSDIVRHQLWTATQRLIRTLGEIETQTTGQPRLAEIAATYRAALRTLPERLDPLLVGVNPRIDTPQAIAAMDRVTELFRAKDLRRALQQAHLVLTALPGAEEDFTPLDVPRAPGSP